MRVVAAFLGFARAFKSAPTSDVGDLQTAANKFAQLTKAHPGDAQYRYMLGLAAKYRMDWVLSLQANLAAIACAPEFDEAAHWNAAITATALHDWQTARQLWAACGIPLPEGTFW